MSSFISEKFGDMGITISNQHIMAIERAAVHFVFRGTHPLTFGGPYLGVHPIAFKTADYNALFDIFDIRKQDVELKIRQIPTIDRNFAVISDPYNLLSMWLVHLAPIYIKDKKVRRDFQASVLKLYHYRIFCSTVNHSWKHGAVEGVAIATVASLSKKSDIIRLESWGRLIDAHVDKMLDPHDRFYPILVDGSPDDMFLRCISDTQSSLRAKIVTYAQAYYEAHKAGNSVQSRSQVTQNAEGEKIVAQTASVVDSATQSMIAEVLNPNMFINESAIDDVANMFTTISPRMLKSTLLRINETAILQTTSRTFDKATNTKDGMVFTGIRALVVEIIRTMIRICRERRINMGNRILVFNEMKDAMRSSRNLDPDVIAIKRSISTLIDPFNITTNQASQSALRLAVIFYLVYRTIDKMK